MDTFKDRQRLEELEASGEAPWELSRQGQKLDKRG